MIRVLPSRWAWPLVFSASLLGVSGVADAQTAQQRGDGATQAPQSGSLSARLSPAVSQRLLRSPDFEDRLRGIRRLAGQNDYAAIQQLLQVVEDAPALTTNPRLRLAAIRAFSPFAQRDPVRKLLLAWATETALRGRTAGPVGSLARDQAAMALAATSNTRAVEQLVLTIIDGGPGAERAAVALAAHPPRNIEPLLRPPSLESPVVVELLGRLGDMRAIPKLRRVLAKGDLKAKVAASIALATLGDASGTKLARDWLSQAGSTHAVRVGAARTLTLVRDPLAPRAIAVLLADPVTRDTGLELAEAAPTPQLAPSLAGLLTISRGPQRVRVLAALARAGGPLAVKTLAALVKSPKLDADAAYALSQCRHPTTSGVLAELLRDPKTRRLAVRASLIRLFEGAETPDGLSEVLASMAASRDDTDRSIGVFGRVIAQDAELVDYVQSKDAVTVLAACRASLGLPPAARGPCIERLRSTNDPTLREGLAGALSDVVTPRGVSTTTLLSLAEAAQASGPVFGRALGPRDAPMFRTRIEGLLRSGDPDMRAQVGIGLGQSPEPSAASLLVEAYAFEPDPWVRRALVLGLAARQSEVGRSWLELAARLDSDEQVRSLARLALAGRQLVAPASGNQVLWLRLSSTSDQTAGPRAVRLISSNGFATVAVTAPDGQALIPGLTPGAARVRVAASAPMQQESSP